MVNGVLWPIDFLLFISLSWFLLLFRARWVIFKVSSYFINFFKF
jgi:hypothetical protein